MGRETGEFNGETPPKPMKFLDYLREDYARHHRDWTLPGFRALAVYRFGAAVTGMPNGLRRKVLIRVYRMLRRRVRNRYGIELYATAKIGRRLLIAHQSDIVIHEFATIGDDCLIRQGVTLGASRDLDFVAEAPILGNRVEVGAGAKIIGAVTIGDDVKIGPNCVVLTNVAAGSSVVPPFPRLLAKAAPRPAEVADASPAS